MNTLDAVVSACLASGAPLAGAAAYVPSTPENVLWGRLPARDDVAVTTVSSGDVVVVDTLSHEGALDDQGRDPVAFFGRHGITDVLPDLVDCTQRLRRHDQDGPHFVTGPIHVEGARPGDALRVDVLELTRRRDYGVISDRHAKDVFAAEPALRPFLQADLSELVRVGASDKGDTAEITGFPAVPLAPFLGIMGVATDTPDRQHSSPPGPHGGNLDLRYLVAGSSLLLPVQVPGAGFYIGDPHFVQGNGELASTALEAPLTATLRLEVIPAEQLGGALPSPIGMTSSHLLVCGLDRDLGRAVRLATAHTLELMRRIGLPLQRGLLWLSAAADVEVTQVVDGVLGAHVVVPIEPFSTWISTLAVVTQRQGEAAS